MTVCITTNRGKFLKRWEHQIPWAASWEICMQVKKEQLEMDMEQWTGSIWGKQYIKAVYCHPAYLTYMQSSCKSLVIPETFDQAMVQDEWFGMYHKAADE